MKTMILAAFTVLGLVACSGPIVNASDFHNGSTVADVVVATRMQQTGSYSP
jgi:hypothetical protein